MPGALGLWTCPECGVEFAAKNTYNWISEKKMQGKVCPNGHWTPLWKLYHARRKKTAVKKQLTLARLRELGICGEIEALQLAVQYLLGSYEQCLNSLPSGSASRAIVQGAFEQAAEMARKVLEE